MSKTANFTNTYKVVFICDEALLKRVENLLKKEAGGVRYSIRLKNGRTIDCDTLKDVLSMNNVGDSIITGISIYSWSSSTSISLNMDSQSSRSIFLRISASEKKIDYLQKIMEETLRSAEAPYARYALLNWFHFLLFFELVYLLIISVPAGLFLLRGGHFHSDSNVNEIFVALLQSILIQTFIYTLSSGLAWGKKRLFPMGSFLIGNGIARHEGLAKRRAIVFSIFFGLITLIAGLVLKYR